MRRGIVLGLGLALLLYHLGKAAAAWWAPYRYEVKERPPVIYWERGAQRGRS